MLTFHNCPWYASSHLNVFRLSGKGTGEGDLWQSCKAQGDRHPNVQHYRSLELIGAGWEYSVFREGAWVFKIPSGKFAEVSTVEYFRNSRENYELLRTYLGDEYVATTFFENDFIRQEWLSTVTSPPSSLHMKEICLRLLRLLTDRMWLPDVRPECDFITKPWNFHVDANGIPKLIDFTAYYDVFRLYEARMYEEIQRKGGHLVSCVAILNQR